MIGPQARSRLEVALLAAHEAGKRPGVEEYRYHPERLREQAGASGE
ncbi:hypothetical protein [Bosea sp. (in: a-proteobacteria)]|nr:hypothetical protein [Bosea sp. (in: a-proteobacteria)]